ncbi:MMPL family transporter [Actinoplanes regularis]|uniref:Putative drug exporter of the RND superfamily n=1 Tax=Actinoplanes regularis TaxID=52697 RepID=A0A239DWJ4_9ACTN|nr:MMPL family transporter [Actinoplanes regularis]GIE88999.1 membrane protein [Actinoplanes regularis]SNS36082.1 putative drug exporter of the RND superfamily [Actinoplanes regularis]
MTGRALAAVGTWVARHPWRMLGVWLVLLAGAVALEPVFSARQTAITYTVDGSESARVEELLRTRFPGRGAEDDLVVLSTPSASIAEPAQRDIVERVLSRLEREPDVVRVLSPYSGPGMVAADSRAAVAAVALRGSRAGIQRRAPELQRLLDDETRGTPVRAYLVGYGPLAQAVVDAETAGASRAEAIGVPIALLVLLLALGTVVAALLPIATGGFGLLLAFGILGLASLATPLNGILSAVVPMIGLGVGIDYAMFLVTRFRENLAAGGTGTRPGRPAVVDAVAAAMRTSGTTVLFSGAVVMMCLLTLLVIPAQTFRHLALGMTLAVGTAVLTALTLLPAVLTLLGGGVERPALPWRDRVVARAERPGTALARWVDTVTRHPVPVAALAVAALLVATLPVLHLRLGIDLGANGLGDSAAGQGHRILAERFSANAVLPLDVVHTARDSGTVTERIRRIPGVAEVLSGPGDRSADGRSVHLSVILAVPPDSAAALEVVRELRALPVSDGDLQVGGPTAEFLDLSEQTRDRTWLVIALVLGLSFVFLTVVFRSLLLPLKAVAMNLLATGAAYGLLVWGFQDGRLARPLDFASSGSVQVYLPLTAFALLFGLSMDYEVFLIRRIREVWRATGDTTHAVTAGLRHTALPITAAAAIMAAVFGAFVTSDVLEMKQIGFGLAAAVLIDATLIRIVLVPAVMCLAGRWNWWLPARLDRLLPHLDAD